MYLLGSLKFVTDVLALFLTQPIDIEKRIDDIEDPKAYSIEDAKQKSEHDRMMQLADRKKATVKKTIVTMRTQFRRLLEKNRDLPEHLQLDRKVRGDGVACVVKPVHRRNHQEICCGSTQDVSDLVVLWKSMGIASSFVTLHPRTGNA